MKRWMQAVAASVVIGLTAVLLVSGCGKKDSGTDQGQSRGAPTGTRTEAPAELTKLRIGYQPTIFYTYLFLAKERGMFEEAGFDVEFQRIPSANKMFQALLAGQLDMTGLTATEVMLLGYEKDPGSFVCPLMVEVNDAQVTDWLLVLQESPVNTIADLRGKTVGSHPGTAVPNIMRAVLRANGVDPESVRITPKKPDVQAEALLSGAVDALICLEPTGTRLQVTGKCRVLMRHPFGTVESAFPGSYAVLSGEFMNDHPEATQKLFALIRQAVEAYRAQAAEDRTVLDRLVAEKLELEPEVATRSSLVTYRLPDEWDQAVFDRTMQFYTELEVLSSPITIDKISP